MTTNDVICREVFKLTFPSPATLCNKVPSPNCCMKFSEVNDFREYFSRRNSFGDPIWKYVARRTTNHVLYAFYIFEHFVKTSHKNNETETIRMVKPICIFSISKKRPLSWVFKVPNALSWFWNLTIAITIVAYAHALVQWPFLLQVDLI